MLMKHIRRAIALMMLVMFTASGAHAQGQPNIVLVFLDNFGWGEPGFNGGGIIRGAATPRLDRSPVFQRIRAGQYRRWKSIEKVRRTTSRDSRNQFC